MAGFRIGRGRDPRNAQQQDQYGGPQAPTRPGAPAPGGHGGPGGPGAYGQRPQWPGRSGGHGEPEYLGGPGGHGGHGGQHPQYGPGPRAAGASSHPDPYVDSAGGTRAFAMPDPYGPGPGDGGHGYADHGDYGPPGPPPGPRLPWRELLSGVLLRPNATFWQMRDHAVWGPALIVTFLYGLLSTFGFESTRESAINTTLANVIPDVLLLGVAMMIVSLILGSVTHTLARQFGGNGTWAPTVGLAMLIMSLTGAPRLLVGIFVAGTEPVMQVLGWASWIASGVLFTMMVGRSHELPWPKALGASAVQLGVLAVLLVLIQLGSV